MAASRSRTGRPRSASASIEVGREERGEREEQLHVGPLGRRVDQPVAAAGHHHRVDDQRRDAGGAASARTTASTTAAVAEHAGLRRRHGHVGGHGVDLGLDERRGPPSTQAGTPVEFCAVTAVMAVVPCRPWAAKVCRSVWMPAPPPESEPAMVRATFIGPR